MTDGWIWFGIMCVLIFLLLMILTLNEYKKLVRSTSKRHMDIVQLNNCYKFYDDIKSKYCFEKRVNSKQQFDRFSFSRFFLQKIEESPEAFEKLIQKLKKNQAKKTAYEAEMESLSAYANKDETKNLKVSYWIYHLLEQKLVEREVLSPAISTEFILVVRYTSPKGKNKYKRQKRYSIKEFYMLYDEYKQEEKRKASKEYQRRKMTDALRHQILQRDGFRCQLCGKSAQTDPTVELEVDHIYPVSKGGKTEPTNLRTLCKACNRGKRDKYDENGLN